MATGANANNASTKTKRRKLLPAEQNLFPLSFRKAINIGNLTLIYSAHNIFVSGKIPFPPFKDAKILARPNRIYWPNCPDDFTKASIVNQSTLMHELCHIWQYHTGRLSTVGYATRPKGWFYKYHFDPKKKFDDYPTEKQADLLQDWYLLNKGKKATNFQQRTSPPTKDQINKIVPFQWS